MLFSIAFTILLVCPTAYCFRPILFTHQSQNIPYTTWFEFFTLCLAPLIAHILAGVEGPTIIGSLTDPKPPTWHDCLTLYNPISILWRWIAIADRRFRARSWDAIDMAACNANFWDADRKRWDGSEEIMLRSRAWIRKAPKSSHIPLLSASMLTTVILTFQGVQASWIIFSRLEPAGKLNFGTGLPNVFIPLGCLGLARLPAALWLLSDYSYAKPGEMEDNRGGRDIDLDILEARTATTKMEDASDHLLSSSGPSKSARFTSTLLPATTTTSNDSSTISLLLYSRTSRRALIYRAFCILVALALFGGSATATTRIFWGYPASFPYISVSHLLFDVLYFIITTSTLIIIIPYILTDRTSSTIIPCIHSLWYKLFTLFFIVFSIVVVVFECLETRQLGAWEITTLPEFYCNKTSVALVKCSPVGKGKGNFNVDNGPGGY